MKKILFLVIGLTICLGLLANITPFGSAKLGWTLFENHEQGADNDDQAYLLRDLRLQSNSHFGLNFDNGDLTARVKVNSIFIDNSFSELNMRELWAEKSFGKWSILAGLAEDSVIHFPEQIWENDNGLVGYGAIDSGTNPMIRLNTEEGFYAALIAPHTDSIPYDEMSVFMPRINLGWDVSFTNYPIRLFPSISFQMLMSDEDLGGNDETLMSFLLNVTGEFDLTPDLLMTLNLNFGQNIADMGFDGVRGGAVWAEDEWKATTTIGLWCNFFYQFPAFGLNAGLGVMMTSVDIDAADDTTDMGFFLNGVFKLRDNMYFTPEFGMYMPEEDDRNTMYLGAQLRFNF